MQAKDPHLNLEEFLKIKQHFQLGHLDTEMPNQLTIGLSQTVKLNTNEALDQFKAVDSIMLSHLMEASPQIEQLSLEIQKTFEAGKRVYLCGCGATGRLSLTIETIWKRRSQKGPDRVRSFMAGGDVALISSIERFEDYPQYGARQLVEMGFEEGDLLLASTEGGETPWVIGASEKASQLSSRKPWFLYCNPDESLIRVERSKKVLENPDIVKFNLSHGPQALAGSTRLQASSILEAAICFALFHESEEPINEIIRRFKDFIEYSDFHLLAPFIQKEASLYQKKEFLFYAPDEDLGISVLTDTTERSPTFSLSSFENYNQTPEKLSWCYLLFSQAKDSQEAWTHLLARGPRALDWEEFQGEACEERLVGFDFSREVLKKRSKLINGPKNVFQIHNSGGKLHFQLGQLQAFWDVAPLKDFELHLFLKLLLNTHSTLLMGLMDRYQSNIMTWVRASNLKLIDRTIRYAQYLLDQKEKTTHYDTVAKICFKLKKETAEDRPLVIKIYEEILEKEN